MSFTEMVTIVVPCRDEAAHIAECLDSIVASDYPADRLEILVVDGMSRDGTREIVREYAARHPHVRLMDNERQTAQHAMNVGVRAAHGDVVVRMDAHSVFPPSYVSTGVELLASTGADVVGGPVHTLPGAPTSIARAIAVATSHPFGVGNSRFRTSRREGPVDTVPFGAYRSDVFVRFGLFDERLVRNQDNEFCSRVLSGGGLVYMTPRMTADYYNQATARGLARQGFRAGMWNVATVARNPRALRARHFAPMLFVAALAVLAAASAVAPAAGMLLLAVAGLYGGVAAAVGIVLAARHGLAMAFVLPPLFALYHVTYGAGSWAGAARLLFGGWGRELLSPSGALHAKSAK